MKIKQSLIYIALLTGSFVGVTKPVEAATIIEVPFIWTIEPANFSLGTFPLTDNFGGPGFTISDSQVDLGSLTIGFIHNAPVGYTRLDPLPTQVTLNLKATVEAGAFSTTRGSVSAYHEIYIDSDTISEYYQLPEINFDGATSEEPFFESSLSYEENFSLEVSQGQLDVVIVSDIQVRNGNYSNEFCDDLGSEECPYIDLSSGYTQLTLGAELLNPVQTIRYVIPEPLTIFGVGTAVGLGTFFKQASSKQRKS